MVGPLTVKLLNFQTPENFAVNYLKFKKTGQTFGYFIKKMQMEYQQGWDKYCPAGKFQW